SVPGPPPPQPALRASWGPRPASRPASRNTQSAWRGGPGRVVPDGETLHPRTALTTIPRKERRLAHSRRPSMDAAMSFSADPTASGLFRGWYSRGYLPHYDLPGIAQML